MVCRLGRRQPAAAAVSIWEKLQVSGGCVVAAAWTIACVNGRLITLYGECVAVVCSRKMNVLKGSDDGWFRRYFRAGYEWVRFLPAMKSEVCR